jgi:hypothetical protein
MQLEPEFEFFLKHQNELVEQYGGKVVAIKGETVLGAFDDVAEAVRETSKTHALGTFLVQKCEPGVEAYTQIFHSRVAGTR